MIPAIATDMDGIMGFNPDKHGIEELEFLVDDLWNVKDRSGYEFPAHKVVQVLCGKEYPFYIPVETVRLGRQVAREYPMIMATGARLSTMKDRAYVLDFYDWHIMENGIVIADSGFNFDKDWQQKVLSYRPQLEKTAEELRNYGLNLDVEGREAMIRIRKDQNINDQLTKQDLSDFFNEYSDVLQQRGLKIKRNLGNYDILPEVGGKLSAIRYIVREKLGLPEKCFFYLGDDENDHEALCGGLQGFVPRSGHPDTVKWAKEPKFSSHVSVVNRDYSKATDLTLTRMLGNCSYCR